VKLSVVDVAPDMFVKLVPPFVLCCHCTVGVGVPLAAAVKVAVWPALTVWFDGFAVTVGALDEKLREKVIAPPAFNVCVAEGVMLDKVEPDGPPELNVSV
jgi:hypothetical protein